MMPPAPAITDNVTDYVDYLGDWSRADNYRHKHDKMQTVLMQYLKKELLVRDFDAINRQQPLEFSRQRLV